VARGIVELFGSCAQRW